MKKTIQIFILMFIGTGCFTSRGFSQTAGNTDHLKVVIVRHAEKPKTGDNLTCQGINRSLQLVAVLVAKFGVPAYTFVPALGLGESTKHSRMFQTVTPLAAKYNLMVNSKFEEYDSVNIAKDLLGKTGIVLLVWQHHAIAPIVRSLGVKAPDLKWSDDDFDSIWVVTFPKGIPTLTKDVENLTPSSSCSY
ncbi:MAG: histidine phosphatase family protein [Puia sp.]|nr:histidine phosphatase family protein [Puia sp.]